MAQGETVGVIVAVGIGLWVLLSKRKNRTPGRTGIVFVRAEAPPSKVLKNIFVLAILGGLAWFFWWATHTKFWP